MRVFLFTLFSWGNSFVVCIGIRFRFGFGVLRLSFGVRVIIITISGRVVRVERNFGGAGGRRMSSGRWWWSVRIAR